MEKHSNDGEPNYRFPGLVNWLSGTEGPFDRTDASNLHEEGFAGSFGVDQASAYPLLTAAALPPLAYLYGRHFASRPKRRPKPQIKESSLRDVYAQLPRARLLDTLAGGIPGAGLGLGYEWATRPKKLSKDELLARRLRYGGIGAGAGAIGANVIGDRARRYITNATPLYSSGGYGNTADSVMPLYRDEKGEVSGVDWSRIYRAGLLDQPTQDFGTPVEADNSKARYELLRRMFGVHTDRPEQDVWQKNRDSSYSVNPHNTDAEKYLRLFLPTQKFKSLSSAVAGSNDMDAGTSNPGFGHWLLGGMKTALYPRGHDDSGVARVLDRWDFSLDPNERRALMGGLVSGSVGDWENYQKALTSPSIHYQGKGDATQNLKQLVVRHIVDKALIHENPWVQQDLDFEKIPYGNPPDQPRWRVTPTTGEGKPYPGIAFDYDTSKPGMDSYPPPWPKMLQGPIAAPNH